MSTKKEWRKELLGRWRIVFHCSLLLLLVVHVCVCVSVCECIFRGGVEKFVKRAVVSLPPSLLLLYATRSLRDTNRLDDLEDCRTAHHEDEQRQQPRSDGVLLLGVLVRLGDVTAQRDVAAGLLVGDADSLLGGHRVTGMYVYEYLCANH